jgi:hypothetical protein
MVTAKEYRELAVEYYKWADEAETEEVRDAYLRLAHEWTFAALSANAHPYRPAGVRSVTTTRQ